jgi:diguanylate cyclase (GGDEF)-like protein/PAS domain S-box-containing protein
MPGALVVHAQSPFEDPAARRAFLAFCAGTSTGLLLIGRDAGIEWASPSVQDLIGFAPEELVGRSVLEFVEEQDLSSVARILEDTTTDPYVYEVGSGSDRFLTLDVAVRRADGSSAVLEVTGNPLFDVDAIRGGLLTLREVTHRRLVDESLELLAQGAPCEEVMARVVRLAESVVHGGRAAIVVNDTVAVPSGTIVTGPLPGPATPPAVGSALNADGYWFERFDGDESHRGLRSRATFPLLDDDDHLFGHLIVWSPDAGPLRQWTLVGLERAIRVAVIGVERERADRSMRWAASHDALTGAWNRTAFWGEAERWTTDGGSAGSGAVVWVDLDEFKQVNDNHGHSTGDEVLRRTADRIAASVRSEDIVCRLGGDEFVVLCPGLYHFEAAAVCERLGAVLARPITFGGRRTVAVSASVGFSVGALTPEGLEALLDEADQAMYHSKQRR